MSTVIRRLAGIVALNLIVLASLIFIMAGLPGGARDIAALGSPGLLGLWILIQGRRLVARWARWTVATVAGLLFALQMFVLAFLAWIETGFRNTDRATAHVVFLAAAVLVSGVALWVFLHPTRPRMGEDETDQR